MFTIGSFEFHIENAQCKHVFVAGGHSSDYPSFLRGYQDKKERITCLRIGACDAYPSGFAEEYFAGVLFPLHTEEPYPSSPPPNVGGTKQQDAASSRPPCKYFAKVMPLLDCNTPVR